MPALEPATLVDRLEQVVRQRLAATPACHNWDHTLRVRRNALHLAEMENADTHVTECAALLHDIGRVTELADQGVTCHAELGAQLTAQILAELGETDTEFVRHVAECVRTHRFRTRSQQTPQTPEARIVYDADKLDSLGAIGVGRSFHFAGRVGARVHNTEEEALNSDSYSTEDTAYREYLVKQSKLHAHMLTESGRRLAETRDRFMARFFARLNLETTGSDFPEA